MLDCLLYISERLHPFSVTEQTIWPQQTKIYRSTRIDVETNICCTKEDNHSTCMIPATLINSSSSHSSYTHIHCTYRSITWGTLQRTIGTDCTWVVWTVERVTGPLLSGPIASSQSLSHPQGSTNIHPRGACDRATSLWSNSFITVTGTSPWIKN